MYHVQRRNCDFSVSEWNFFHICLHVEKVYDFDSFCCLLNSLISSSPLISDYFIMFHKQGRTTLMTFFSSLYMHKCPFGFFHGHQFACLAAYFNFGLFLVCACYFKRKLGHGSRCLILNLTCCLIWYSPLKWGNTEPCDYLVKLT